MRRINVFTVRSGGPQYAVMHAIPHFGQMTHFQMEGIAALAESKSVASVHGGEL